VNASYSSSVEGLGKNGDRFTFLISIPAPLQASLKSGMALMVGSVAVVLKDCDGEYASFELTLSQVAGTALAEVEVGSSVTLLIV